MGPSQQLAWVARRLAEAVVEINRLYLRMYKVPPLYSGAVVYQEEPAGQGFEEFAPIPQVLQRGWGDCDDLVPWRVAELREMGEPAQIRLLWQRPTGGPHKGKKLFHLVVRRAVRDPITNRWRASRQFECPSTILGMNAL